MPGDDKDKKDFKNLAKAIQSSFAKKPNRPTTFNQMNNQDGEGINFLQKKPAQQNVAQNPYQQQGQQNPYNQQGQQEQYQQNPYNQQGQQNPHQQNPYNQQGQQNPYQQNPYNQQNPSQPYNQQNPSTNRHQTGKLPSIQHPVNTPNMPQAQNLPPTMDMHQSPIVNQAPTPDSQATLNMPTPNTLATPIPNSQPTLNMPTPNSQPTLNMPAPGSQPTVTMLTPDASGNSTPNPQATIGMAAPNTPPTTLNMAQPAPPKRKDPFRLLGTLLSNKYEIQDFLGQGGMGAVYMGQHKRLGKDRAIKILTKSANVNEKEVKRFFQEAQAAASIQHPNVVHVHDIDETNDFYFIVMEYVKGKNLDSYVKTEKSLQPGEAIEVAKSAALGLQAIHHAGLIHRDIKPANFMLGDDFQVKITDFGIVKDVACDTELTKTGTIIGTPQYMSPEQITKGPMDGRSDIYSLGATLYFSLAGDPCFTGTTMQLMYQVLNTNPIPLHEIHSYIPQEMNSVIFKMLEKQTSDRYANMEEVYRAFDELSL